MNQHPDKSNKLTPRENLLFTLLNKFTKEYKVLLEFIRRTKPFKIVEILDISNIPGESRFIIQIANQNSILKLSAAEIISQGYNLNDFNEFHAEMIKRAAQGKLIQFLSIANDKASYKITSKRFDRDSNQNIFTIETNKNQTLSRTANEIAQDKNLLAKMELEDVLDIGYTHGSESVLKEKLALLLLKQNSSQS